MPDFVSHIVEYLVASEPLRGSLIPGQEEIFLISLKSHTPEGLSILIKLKDRFWIFRARRGGLEKCREKKKKMRVFTNSLCPFKIRKLEYELLPPSTQNFIQNCRSNISVFKKDLE